MVADTVIPGSQSWLRLARIARILASFTLVWLGIEGTVGVIAGILAGSIALIAFGMDSAIEGLRASSYFGGLLEREHLRQHRNEQPKNG
jgi:hypothetical protein